MAHNTLFVLVLASILACGGDPPTEDPVPRRVEAVLVSPPQPRVVRLPARVQATRAGSIAFEVGGRVTEVLVNAGEAFATGDVLARLNARSLRLATLARSAELDVRSANREEAESSYSRYSSLVESGAVARADYDRVVAAREMAGSQEDMARAALAMAREQLSDAVLRAPYAGTVGRRLVEEGETVSAGQPAFTLVGSGGLEARVEIPESLIDAIALGSEHTVIATGSETEFAGTVTEVASDAGPSGTFAVRLSLPAGAARSGATAEALLRLPAATELVIPFDAFEIGADGSPYVFVIDEYDTLERTTVVLGELSGDSRTVLRGVEEGTRLVARGVQFLSDGDYVRVDESVETAER